MEHRDSFRVTPQLILGLAAIVVGVLFTLENLGYAEVSHWLRFWPTVLIVFGAAKAVQPEGATGRLIGAALVAFGGILLLENLGYIRFSVWDLLPLVFVFVGLSLVWRAFSAGGAAAEFSGSTVAAMALLGGVVRKSSSQSFRGGELTAIMGGTVLDLREASIDDGQAVISTLAFWGGVEIRVPGDWAVVSRGMALLGGFEDATSPPAGGSTKQLVVKGFAIMGGVEIKN